MLLSQKTKKNDYQTKQAEINGTTERRETIEAVDGRRTIGLNTFEQRIVTRCDDEAENNEAEIVVDIGVENESSADGDEESGEEAGDELEPVAILVEHGQE